MTPDISIIIPTHNRKELLAQAVQSCIAQKGVSMEIIIVDDGSTDGTEEFCAQLRHPVIFCKQKNKGPAAARNLGMIYASGEFIKFLDDDDLLAPDSLINQITILRAEDADMAYAPWRFCDMEIQSLGSIEGSELHEPAFSFLLTGWWYPAFAYLFRRSFLEENGCKWDEEFYYLADLNFILNVSVHDPVLAWSPLLSGLYRRHDVQLSNIVWDEREQKRIGILRHIEKQITHQHLQKTLLQSKTNILSELYA